MFGYVRPLRCTLRVMDLEFFRAAYCGLCHTLRDMFDWRARYLLGYDSVFLALVYSLYDDSACAPRRRRCPTHLCKGRAGFPASPSSELAADASVLLMCGKLGDTILDERGAKAALAGTLSFFLRRARAQAERRRPDVARQMETSLARLHEMETARPDALDPPADAFAAILSSLGAYAREEKDRRVLRHLFYHLGRWIYLMDAYQDVEEDGRMGRYNAVAARYGVSDGRPAPEAKQSVYETARLSRYEVERAASLLPQGPATPVVENVVFGGLPYVEERVLERRWPMKKEKL